MANFKRIISVLCAGAITFGAVGIFAQNNTDTVPYDGSGVYFKEVNGEPYIFGVAPKTTVQGLKNLLGGECVTDEEGEYVKTGTRVITYKNDTQENISTVIIHGDVDCDGKVTAKDVVKIKKYVAGQPFSINEVAADIDMDGDVDENDKQLASEKANAVLTSLKVAKKPEKSVYTDGEKLECNGLILSAVYSNGDTFGVADGYQTEYPAGDGRLSQKYQYVTVNYGGVSAKLPLTVNEYSSHAITDTVYYTMPAIPAQAGVKVDLSKYSVQFSLGQTVSSGITWASSELTVSANTVTPKAKGVYTLNASYNGKTKAVYLVVKERTDSEYVLYENSFDNGAGDLRVTQNASLVSASNGKMTIGAKNSAATVLLPEYVSSFGDYKITASTCVSAYASEKNTVSLLYRGGYSMDVMANASFENSGVSLNYTLNGTKYALNTNSYSKPLNKVEFYDITLDVHGVCSEGYVNGARLVSSFENNGAYNGNVGIYASGVTAVLEDIKVTLDFDKPSTHGTVGYTMPAIPAISGNSIWLNGYDVQFNDGQAVNAKDITWSSSEITVSSNGVVTPSSAGVYKLTAKASANTKTVYLVVKNAADSEYLLYNNEFSSFDGITKVSGTSSVSGGKLYLNGKTTPTTVVFPDYIGDFGNYSIETNFTISEYENDGSWLSIMFRVKDPANDYYQLNVRQNAANNSYNGVELTSNNNGTWQYLQMNSYKEALALSKSYKFKVDVKDDVAKGYIDGNSMIFCDTVNARSTGKAALQTYGINAAFENVKITLDFDSCANYRAEEYFDYSSIKPDNTYVTEYYGEELLSYYDCDQGDFYGACSYFEKSGARLYNKHNMNNGNLSATYVSGGSYYHVYYLKTEGELNVVVSANGAHLLPDNIPEKITGDYMPTVTQVYSFRVNGMTYIIQLADGTFIVYDGGWEDVTEDLWAALTRLNGGEEGIVVRSWILTHAHEDHTYGFIDFSEKYASKIKVERIMISPISASDTDTLGFPFYVEDLVSTVAKRFKGAVICPVHTGMLFNYCGVKLEILMAAEEIYKDDFSSNFNNTSMVSRIFNGEYSCLFLADAAKESAKKLITYYNYYMTSNMCQVSHHGVENFPLAGYKRIRANTLWYPCDTYLYELPDRDADVRAALREYTYTKEIILHDSGTVTRKFGY